MSLPFRLIREEDNRFSLYHLISNIMLPDEVMGRAYDNSKPEHKALIKKQISRLYSIYGRNPSIGHEKATLWNQDFYTGECTLPLDWTMLVLSHDFKTPAGIAAALIPALCAGVYEVCAVFVTGNKKRFKPDGSVLLALELLGIDMVFVSSIDDLGRMILEIGKVQAGGALLFAGDELLRQAVLEHPVVSENPADLVSHHEAQEGDEAGNGKGPENDKDRDTCRAGRSPLLFPPRGISSRWLTPPERVGVWNGSVRWNMDALDYFYNGAEIHIGAEVNHRVRKKFVFTKGNVNSFANKAFDVLLLPPEMLPLFSNRAPLTLGPGEEPVFLWPELRKDSFQRNYISFSSHSL